MKFITLNMVTDTQTEYGMRSSEPVGEDDGIGEVQPVVTKPNSISIDQIRNFYPRKNDQPGSRVVLKSGTAYVVTESHNDILAKVSRP